MKFDGPTVGLLADDSFGAFADLANIPMSAARLVNRGQMIPMPPQMRNPGFSTPALSLGLHQPENQPEDVKAENDLRGTKNKRHEEEIESRSGSGSENLGNASGDEQGPQPKKKRYHRHTARQIQEMEAFFKECPHPDDKQRQELSHSLGLEPRQVKFWFQNRRTQLKAQQERAENSVLRVERDKLMAENITLTQALRSSYCPRCEGPTSVRDVSFDEHNLRIENAYLKEELERITHVTMKLFGRNQNFSPQAPQFSASSLNLSVGGGSSSPPPSSGLFQAPEEPKALAIMNDGEKSRNLALAVAAMEEVLQLSQVNHPVWFSSPNGLKEIFSVEEYRSHFPKSLESSPCSFSTDASRDTGMVTMSAAAIVETLMDATKYMSFFPTMVAKAVTLEVITCVNAGTLDGTLQLMCAEIQVMSPLIQAREFYFLRFSKQADDGTWCVIDFPADGFRNTPPASTLCCRRCPSGFIIRDEPEGFTKVVVVEHIEYDQKFLPESFRSFVNSGAAFGAPKWIAALQRQSEALHFIHSNVASPRDIGGLQISGRQNLLKLSQKMTSVLCQGVGATVSHSWTILQSGCGLDESNVRLMTRKTSDNAGEPGHGIVLCASTTIWLQSSPQQVYDYIRLEHVRNEWALNSGIAEEVVRIAKSEGDGNAVSLFQINNNQNNPLMLQESWSDASGSIVAYAPVDVPTLNMLIQGGDPAQIPVLPSGFAILPDGAEESGASGTLLTVSIQILVAPPSAKLPMESVMAINSLINSTVQKVQAALSQNNEI